MRIDRGALHRLLDTVPEAAAQWVMHVLAELAGAAGPNRRPKMNGCAPPRRCSQVLQAAALALLNVGQIIHWVFSPSR
jgi:hypothetical protein